MKYIQLYMLSGLLILASCKSVDLSLVNEVKRFEPEWMNLSEKVSFIDRNLRITQRKYSADLEEVTPYINNAIDAGNTNMYNLRSQYKTMVNQRDELQKEFDAQKENFIKEVGMFNQWVNALMQNDLNQEKAKSQFVAYKKTYDDLKTQIDETQTQVIKNIEEHNAVLKRITGQLRLYTNYDINVK